ncbi:MAG: hypothetical protein MJE68_10615, partial [Proteobacteria bacterium]|nr:hypothetical protein [Pseudomonadota bacterium]
MSKLAGAAPSMTPLTMCPGTLAYMPPEALRDPPRYTKKLDCFSDGVIMIQVCTRLWPEPGPRTQLIQDSRYPTGTIEVPVLEIERRKNHIEKINPIHMLLPIAVDCLHYQENDRPSSEELCQRLAGLKESKEYRESTHQIQDQSNSDACRVLQRKYDEIQERNRLLQQKEKLLQEEKALRERQVQEERMTRERQLRQLNQQLKEQEQVTAEIQRQVEQLQQQLSQQSLKPPLPPPPSQAQARGRQFQERESKKKLPVQSSLHVDHKPQPLNWRDGDKAPLTMYRGAAVVDVGIAYFMSWSGEVCSYNVSNKKWSKLAILYPYYYSSLAVINGHLTAIGGCKEIKNKDTYTNKLLSLPGYREIFPAMLTKRRDTTAVTSKEHLIVAGGAIGSSNIVDTVEVMDTKSLVWSTAASLPHPYSNASLTICVDQLYMLGGSDGKGMTKSVLTCSLIKLLQSSPSSIWHRV